MVRHRAVLSMSKFVIALFTAMLIAVIGGMVSPAQAHHCGCQVDNSGPGSSGPDNSGPGNACHDNSGPGSTTSGSDNSGTSGSSGSGNSGSSGSSGSDTDNSGSDSGPGPNSGPGNGDECPPDDPGEDPGGDSGDNPGSDSTDTSDSGDSASDSGVQVLGAEASVASSSGTQAAVPAAVNAGLTDTEESSSAVAALMILLGLGLLCGATVRRRTRA
jgi:hypothetical protein